MYLTIIAMYLLYFIVTRSPDDCFLDMIIWNDLSVCGSSDKHKPIDLLPIRKRLSSSKELNISIRSYDCQETA